MRSISSKITIVAVLLTATAVLPFLAVAAPSEQIPLAAEVSNDFSPPENAVPVSIYSGSNNGRLGKQKKPPARSCSQAPTHPGDRRENLDELTIGNFNAEWLFLYGGSGAMLCPGRGCPWKNKDMALRHMRKVAQTIRSMELPDIVHLSEVEGCDTLGDLIEMLESDFGAVKGAYRPYLVPGKDTALGQQVGLITKVDPIMDLVRTDDRAIYPVKGSTCGFTKPGAPSKLTGASKNYLAVFPVNEMRVLLTGTHLIAYPDKPERCERREAQATVLADAVRAHIANNPQSEVIILGDFNDYDDEVMDAAGAIDTPISQALSLLRSSTTPAAPALFNVAKSWSNATERYTNWYDRNGDCRDDGGDEHVLIDHMLISEGLRARLVSSRPDHSYTQSCGTLQSDHWPMIAKFRTPRNAEGHVDLRSPH
ncbi:hypothetical protein HKX48_001203 [Thoreauomyces humboldtii]|nr:hypothetical protein HKX48_001203 [Thoreauomyces humboldtii]